MNISTRLMLKKKLENKGEININPRPNIWIAVLYFPTKSDFTSAIYFEFETMYSLK